MSYPPYNAGYNTQGGPPSFPSTGYPSQPSYGGQNARPPASGSPVPPHAAPPHGYPQQGYGGYPQQPPYGGYPAEPGFQAPQPGGYTPHYAPQYGQGYGASAPPAPQHNPPYPDQHPGAGGYDPRSRSPYPPHAPQSGSPYPPQASQHGSPYPPQAPQHGSPYPPPAAQHAYGTAPPPQQAPVSTTPTRFTFAQKEGFDRSGSIKDASGKVVYKLKDESDKHTWTAYLKTRPLVVSRADGTKIAVIQWKDSPSEAKLELYAVWGSPGGKPTKMKVEGEVLDQDYKFRLPSGAFYEWDIMPSGQYNLLDHQQIQGQGLDAAGKPVARYTPHSETTDATLDMMPEALAVPNLLDAAIITSFHLEYVSASENNDTGDGLAAINAALSN